MRVWDPVIKRGGFGIQLSRGEGLGSSYQEGGVGTQLSRGEGLRSSYQEGGLGSSYQEERVWDPVIKRGGFEI